MSHVGYVQFILLSSDLSLFKSIILAGKRVFVERLQGLGPLSSDMVADPCGCWLKLGSAIRHPKLYLGLDELRHWTEANEVLDGILEKLKCAPVLPVMHHQKAPEVDALLVLLPVGLWVGETLSHGFLGL